MGWRFIALSTFALRVDANIDSGADGGISRLCCSYMLLKDEYLSIIAAMPGVRFALYRERHAHWWFTANFINGGRQSESIASEFIIAERLLLAPLDTLPEPAF